MPRRRAIDHPRTLAREAGQNKYQGTRPCPKCTTCWRYTLSTMCVECTKNRTRYEKISNRKPYAARVAVRASPEEVAAWLDHHYMPTWGGPYPALKAAKWRRK
jgi:hypothetical protein